MIRTGAVTSKTRLERKHQRSLPVNAVKVVKKNPLIHFGTECMTLSWERYEDDRLRCCNEVCSI